MWVSGQFQDGTTLSPEKDLLEPNGHEEAGWDPQSVWTLCRIALYSVVLIKKQRSSTILSSARPLKVVSFICWYYKYNLRPSHEVFVNMFNKFLVLLLLDFCILHFCSKYELEFENIYGDYDVRK
jgi:hypothetical protein